MTARTDLDLVPGTQLHAYVHSDGEQLVLRLGRRPADALATALARQGLVGDEAAKLIARALMSVGLPVRAESVAVLQRATSSWPQPPRGSRLSPTRLTRSLAMLLARGIDVMSPGARQLVEVMNYEGGYSTSDDAGDGDRRDGQRRRDGGQQQQGRRPPALTGQGGGTKDTQGGGAAASVARRLAEQLGDASRQISPLAVFNHLPSRAGDGSQWYVLPVSLRAQTDGQELVAGSLRLCYRSGSLVHALLETTTHAKEPNAADVSATFVLPCPGGARTIRAIASDGSSAAALRDRLPALADKVRNLGFELDDIVEEDPTFDGFSDSAQPSIYEQIDTLR